MLSRSPRSWLSQFSNSVVLSVVNPTVRSSLTELKFDKYY